MNIENLYIRYFAGLIIVWVCIFNGSAQNLAPNPSFEEYTSCPRSRTGKLKMLAPPWEHPAKATIGDYRGSPDLYNTCSPLNILSVPKNEWGYQHPHSGDGYGGILGWADILSEYIQAPLLEPLKAGETYYVGFYISLADRFCAAEQFGMHFSIGSVPLVAGNGMFDYEPQIESNSGFLSDTSTWILIDGCYVASGGETHITIGNFRTPNESELMTPCSRIRSAYYYIDDVFVYNMSTLDLGDDASLCPGDSLILVAGYGDTQYLWQDLSTADTFLVETPGLYYVSTTNRCGTASDTILISLESNPPQIDLPDSLAICDGDEIILDPQIQGVEFAWSNGSDLPQLSIDTAGEYGLTVTNGCGSDEATVVIEDNGSAPTVSLGSVISICPGEVLEVQPISSNVDTWLWSDGSISPNLIINSPGSIYVVVTNECGTASDTVYVVQNTQPPTLDLGDDILACTGDVILLQADVTGVAYIWQDGSTQPTLSVAVPGAYSLQVSNACGASSDTITVEFNNPPPFPFLGNDTILCVGEVLTLQWSGPSDVGIQWESGSTSQFNFVDITGEYSILATNDCGSSYDTIEVLFISPPAPFSLGNDTFLCSGQSFLLLASSGTGNITWQDGSHHDNFLANQTQLYSASIFNQCGMVSDEIYVLFDSNTIYPPNDLTIDLCPQEQVVLDVTQGFDAEYIWSTGADSPAIEIQEIGNYDVSISTTCFSEVIQFEILPGIICDFIPDLFIPNVFSPNGDNINDEFIINTVPYFELFDIQFMVYDRWGNLVLTSSGLPVLWDGIFREKPLPTGVYTYTLKLVNKLSRETEFFSGDITLIR